MHIALLVEQTLPTFVSDAALSLKFLTEQGIVQHESDMKDRGIPTSP